MIAFVIWMLVTCIFIVIGMSSYRASEPVGFFSNVEPPKISPDNVKKYNHAVAKIWLVFSIIFGLMGVPFLFFEQNSPVFLLIIIAVMFLVIFTMAAYLNVKRKYEEV